MNEIVSINQLAKMVYMHCGLNYISNTEHLMLKLQKRFKHLAIDSAEAYIKLLFENNDEWNELVECLTINETYFNREEKQLQIFSNDIYTKQLINRLNPIKIWSAACSTGEEPYSIMMNTLDVDPNAHENLEITATDITPSVLQTAQKGAYFEKSLTFRRIPKHWLNDYFKKELNYYCVNDNIKSAITFKHLNLLDLSQYPSETYDVIYCRNVLIYFDEATVEKVVREFYHALKKGGILFLGHAEMISKFKLPFEMINDNGTFYYRKE